VNLLALTVHRLLSEPPIRGFYFPHTQYDNALTEQKLEEACDSCMVFVQLIQPIMFDHPFNGVKNYCFFEWSRVRTQFRGANSEKRILFVVAVGDRDIFRDYLPFIDYDDWYKHLHQKDPPYLPEMHSRNEQRLAEIRALLKGILVPQIRLARLRFVDTVP
jgi:hypothetical protein